jgi:competence protein ComEC
MVEGTRAVLTVAILGMYMVLTGGRPSVVRAVIMAALFIGGIFFQRSSHPLNTLGVAILILLAVRPPALFDVGFQLSVAAVAGIVSLNPRFLEGVPESIRESEFADWIVSTGTVSAAAILGTAPVLLYHFGWVSVAGLLLNMAGIPFTGLALSAAILTATVGGLWAFAGAAFGSAADLFVRGLLATSRYGAEWFSWAGLRMAAPDPWALGALVAGLIALAQWPRPRNRWRWIVVGLFLAMASVWQGPFGRDARPTLDVVSFDVGQGGAALVSTPQGSHVLVDAGPRSPQGSAAEFAVLPYLDRWGIHRLDAVLVTHPDEDHLGGLPTLLREVSVGRVVDNGWPADTELYEETQSLIDRKEVSRQVVQRGDTLAVDSAVRIEVLSPPRHPEQHGIEERNDASLVLRFSYGNVDVLFPGDVETAGEQDLVRAYGSQLGSRIVKVPHHGSITSSSLDFVRAATAQDERSSAVVSVGRGEQYGMPSPEVMSRWEGHGANVYSTAQGGAVWLRTDGRTVWEVAWR